MDPKVAALLTPQQLAEQNMGLAHQQAHHFAKYKHLSFDDLQGEAMVALVEAANHYRADVGVRFSTYATRCIVRRLVNALEIEKRRQLPQDTAAWGNDDESIVDSVPDDVPVQADDELERLAKLPPGPRFTLEMNMGLWDGKFYTPKEIAFHLSLTVKQVNAHLESALQQLKESANT